MARTDEELNALEIIVKQFELLDRSSKRRMLEYIIDRFGEKDKG
jgi:hypothetical protein